MKLFSLTGVLGLVAALEVVVLGAVLVISRLPGSGDAWNSSVLVAFCTVLPLLLAQWYQGRRQRDEAEAAREERKEEREAAALELTATREAAEAAKHTASAALARAEDGAVKLDVIGHNVDGAKAALEEVAQRLRDRLTQAGIAQPPGTGGVDTKGAADAAPPSG